MFLLKTNQKVKNKKEVLENFYSLKYWNFVRSILIILKNMEKLESNFFYRKDTGI